MITIRQGKDLTSESRFEIRRGIEIEDTLLGMEDTLPEAILFVQGVLNNSQELSKPHEISMVLVPNTPAFELLTPELSNAYLRGIKLGEKISH